MVEEKNKPNEEKKEKKIVETIKEKKEAKVSGRNLTMSIKHAVAICNMIRRKNIDKAISMLEEVIKFKRVVPMKGEIPHKKGIMSGRYPVKASLIILNLLKSLKANALLNELELEKFELFCMPNVAFRPYKRFGQGRIKRSSVELKLIPLKIKKGNKGVKK